MNQNQTYVAFILLKALKKQDLVIEKETYASNWREGKCTTFD